MKFLTILLSLISYSQANVITIGQGIEKNGKKYFLQYPDCKVAFYAGDKFSIEKSSLNLKWKGKYIQSKKYLTPNITGYVQIEDQSKVSQVDLSEEIKVLKKLESGNNRKLYEQCSSNPKIVLLSSIDSDVTLISDEFGSVQINTVGGKTFMSLNLNPLIESHELFLNKFLDHNKVELQLELSSLQEIASCKINSSYSMMSRFKDIVYYDQVCNWGKTCKKFWFVTECWEEYSCKHIPYQKRIFIDSMMEDATMFELSTSAGSAASQREYLIDQCLDGFIVSNFMSQKIEHGDESTKVTMDTLLREYKDEYTFQTSLIEAYPIKLSLPLVIPSDSKTVMQKVYGPEKFNCFKQQDSIWFTEDHKCIKEII